MRPPRPQSRLQPQPRIMKTLLGLFRHSTGTEMEDSACFQERRRSPRTRPQRQTPQYFITAGSDTRSPARFAAHTELIKKIGRLLITGKVFSSLSM